MAAIKLYVEVRARKADDPFVKGLQKDLGLSDSKMDEVRGPGGWKVLAEKLKSM